MGRFLQMCQVLQGGVSWTHPHCPHCGGRWERCYEQTYVAQQRRPRSNKNRQKSSQQNAWEWSWEEESTPTRPASLREVFPPNSKHLVVDVGKHGPRAEATRRRFRILLHQPCRPHGKPDKDVPKETAQATSSSADAGTSAELALCLREAYPDPKSMPESALKALTKVDVRSSKQTQLWLHLLPDELDIPKPAAPVTAREYNRVHDIPSSFAELQVQDDSTSMLATLLSSTSSTAQRWWGPIRCSSLFRLKQGRGLSPLDVPVAWPGGIDQYPNSFIGHRNPWLHECAPHEALELPLGHCALWPLDCFASL